MSAPLLEALVAEAIILDAPARSGAEAIALLAARLQGLGFVHPSYGEAAIAREATMPTGLPLGEINVAIPHTDMRHVIRPAIALALLAEPVEFASMDDPEQRLPVRIVFALALTDKHAQIAMLQAVMEFIQDKAALRRLLDAGSPQAVQAAIRGDALAAGRGEAT